MVGWTLTVGALAYASGVTSVGGWAMVLVLACAPPLIMLRLWRVPVQSMSESIRKALR